MNRRLRERESRNRLQPLTIIKETSCQSVFFNEGEGRWPLAQRLNESAAGTMLAPASPRRREGARGSVQSPQKAHDSVDHHSRHTPARGPKALAHSCIAQPLERTRTSVRQHTVYQLRERRGGKRGQGRGRRAMEGVFQGTSAVS